MRRMGAGVMAAALVWGGLAAATTGRAAAQETQTAPKSGGLWNVWFGDKSSSKPAEAPTSRPTSSQPAGNAAAAAAVPSRESKSVAAATLNPLPPSSVLKQAEAAYQHEQQAYLRRMEVCDRLRGIALEKGDNELESQANLLLDRAWTIFEQRTARLPRPAPAAVPGESSADTGVTLSKQPYSVQGSTSAFRDLSGVGRATVTGEGKP